MLPASTAQESQPAIPSSPEVSPSTLSPANRAADGEPPLKRFKPKKADFRQRAHCNPLSDPLMVYPVSPRHVDWSMHFPKYFHTNRSQEECEQTIFCNTKDHPIQYDSSMIYDHPNRNNFILDIGCGFGGLLVSLGPLFPNNLIMGMEIREQVTNYVGERIRSMRLSEGPYKGDNIAVIRTNAMKFLANYFPKGSCDKMFFCFPDPHFKKHNWRRRIINDPLMSLYAYVLKPGGLLYTVTDVEDLHIWMRDCGERQHELFERVTDAELAGDPCIKCIENDTEEGKKVKRAGKPCYTAVFRRRCDPPSLIDQAASYHRFLEEAAARQAAAAVAAGALGL
ncbi:tRNA (guanine-N(7)-)-methyltransferase [Perkinsus olseni]|uniref:tRNA (guanine-N(7)-)-methyltransferase n=1 Tax=Perkinsus olseni TaxID=32597 RepID=A0A7J6MWH1_PEROL|nr:tRNA (guanine-N(7)-)-methyltransferase [Perkinsus olseni]